MSQIALNLLQTVVAIATGLQQAGTNSSGPITVPDNTSLRVRAYVDTSAHTNPVSVFRLSVDVSMDGGQTWNVGWRWCSRPGGPGAPDVNGVALQNMSISDQLPDGVGRQIRINITNNTPLQTGAFVDYLVPA